MNPSVSPIIIQKVGPSTRVSQADHIAVEEPLEIRLDYAEAGQRQQKSLSITMRTPGADHALAVGFLFTEGIIHAAEDIVRVAHCGPALPHLGHSNVVKVELAPHKRLDLASLTRHFYTSSSCGVCGKSSIEALKTQNHFSRQITPKNSGPFFTAAMVHRLPERLREAQPLFASTGGLHASALFSPAGDLLAVQEDVGRHNALDKLIGEALRQGQLPLSTALLMVSGRVSFELVQKASMAGIRCMAAVGAPSSLALELCREMGMTLLGFVRDERFNIYCGEERIL